MGFGGIGSKARDLLGSHGPALHPIPPMKCSELNLNPEAYTLNPKAPKPESRKTPQSPSLELRQRQDFEETSHCRRLLW